VAGVNLLELAKALSPNSQWEAYQKARATPGQEQMAGALEIANPMMKLRYINEHPQPGQMVAYGTRDASGRTITRYYGDARAWRTQFEAPAIPCIAERPR
jgi:hypothetical protein